MKKAVIAASVSALMAMSAHAEVDSTPKGYVGVNLSRLSVDIDEAPDTFNYGHLSFRIGGRLNDYIAIEGRAGFGVTDDSISGNGAEVTVETKRSIGGYVLAGIPNQTPVYPYVILGYTGIKSEVTASVYGATVFNDSGSDDDVSYGVGANVSITERSDFNLEYLVLYEDSEVEISALTAGLMYRF
ncbi:porin family protein [Marinobacter zhejiangensis]|uniref:Outer membrane autotransporter barrel domain-containing protein n=1 Tax=Marinobacter zhejiangensis TaxID=488535 RepID=A0A1I4STX0_9GAMM|nr:porin family protein [Marinobacter zhejiangensis]SFM67884.1 outer membrane autotransporter barrel domain-containing protein [Marinobacter zhejiangensis]